MKVSELMRRDVITVDARDDLALAQQVMLWNGVRHLPVLRKDQLVGVLSERDLLAARVRAGGQWGSPAPRVEEAMSRDLEQITPDADLADAAGVMATRKLGCLPVLDDGIVVGMLTAIDVLASDAQCPVPPSRLPAAEVGAVMTRRLAAVHPDDRIVDAAALMQQRGARHIPVIDGDRRLVGMLSDRDVRTAIGNPLAALEGQGGARVHEMRVMDAMTREPRSLRPDDALSTAVHILLEERFGAIPVIEEDDEGNEVLVGIVSYVDVLRALAGPVDASQ